MNDIFNINKFNVIEDDFNYYFFRALNMADINDINDNIILDDKKHITRIRTDRERYIGSAKYSCDNKLSLEEIYDHIKMYHRKDTNCISLTSNANVAITYGRGNYQDKYIMCKVDKNELENDIVNAGMYMLEEIEKRITLLFKNNKLNETEKYFLTRIDEAQNQSDLDKVKTDIEALKNIESISDNFEKGITFDFNSTNSKVYQSLNQAQNLVKNKMILKLDVINRNIISNTSNKLLIQTLGNAFSSLEYIHYLDIPADKIIEVNKELIDVFSILQQVPSNLENIEDIKKAVIRIINDYNVKDTFKYSNNHLSNDNDYTIENMYNITNGSVDFNTAISIYKKSFYLAKAKLRTLNSIELLKKITNNDSKYNEIFTYLKNNTYGIEPEIISRINSNKLNISESVNLDFSVKEIELFNYINSFSQNELETIMNYPNNALNNCLNNLSNVERRVLNKDEYYANAIVDLFDWKKMGIIAFSPKQKAEIINKLLDCHVVYVYDRLKNQGVRENIIANTLLTIVIKNKDLNDIDLDDAFTVEELEDFLGYYKVKDTAFLKLRSYQASALKNINYILQTHQFVSAILPTGAGKSFVALAKMIENRNAKILYLAPNDIILNQIEDYIIEYIYGTKGTLVFNKSDIIKQVFPNLKLKTYSALLSENQDEIINDQYNLIILDEEHRSGALKWKGKVEKLFHNQSKTTKIVGITATSERDVDFVDMADEWARYFDYSEEEIEKHNHLAINMTLEDAIRLGYVVNPRVVNCEYNLLNDGEPLYNLQEKIKNITNKDIQNIELEKFKKLRKRIEKADKISKIIGDNVKLGGRYIVFLPVINNDGKNIEDDDGNIEDYRIYGDDVIEKYKSLLTNYLKEYYSLSDVEINSMLEFHSMLGKYGRAKNQFELEQFEQRNHNRIKFMLVMNKLNEGSHAKNDGLIWFRPLDKNSKILFQQQFGRIIYAINPNEKVFDDQRPVAIDLVGNVFNYAINKDRKKTDDLDRLKIIISWMEENNNRIPNLNSKDKVEASHGSFLKKIQLKYNSYLQVENKKNISNKIEKILTLGNEIDLWNYEFPEKIIITERDKNNSDTEEYIFGLEGILKDFYDLNEEINKYAVVTLEDKKEQLIQSIKELKRLPKQKHYNDGISEKIFTDGTDQRSYYRYLKEAVDNINIKIDRNDVLTEGEFQKLKALEEIELVLSEYVISREEKKQQLIQSIEELKRLPKEKSKNSYIAEKVFADGTDQRKYYDHLKESIGKINEKLNRGIHLTELELQKLQDFKEIESVLSKYIVSTENKKLQLIQSIEELKRLPKRKEHNKGILERIFIDGTDQRAYYDILKGEIKKIVKKQQNNKSLTNQELHKLKDFEEIELVLNKYTASFEMKKQILILSIKELERLPKLKTSNEGFSEKEFVDGTDQRSYYETLKKDVKTIKDKLLRKVDLTKKERQKLKAYEEIELVLNKYTSIITPTEKKQILIQSIEELKRLPKLKSNNNGVAEKTFVDGTDQRRYYEALKTAVNNIYKKKEIKKKLTSEEDQKLKDFEEIELILNKYVVSFEEKKQQLIQCIDNLKRLPKEPNDNGGIVEKTFTDGTSQRSYYNHLQGDVNLINEKLAAKKELTKQELQKLKAYEEIKVALNKYTVLKEEKKQILIQNIQELKRLPKPRYNNKGVSERMFVDGTDQRGYYDTLKSNVGSIHKKQKRGAALTGEELQKLKDYEEINSILKYYPTRRTDNQRLIEELCNSYNIDILKNKSILNKAYYEVYIKIKYLIDNNLNIVANDGLIHEIFFMADINMQVKYNISLEELVDKYINKQKRL